MRKEDNELLVRVGPGTAMGQVFRSYWSPIADAKQLADKDSDPLRVRFCGEDYVAFRDSDGKLGLLDELCPHRGASLALVQRILREDEELVRAEVLIAFVQKGRPARLDDALRTKLGLA